jgi:hypothetical protein
MEVHCPSFPNIEGLYYVEISRLKSNLRVSLLKIIQFVYLRVMNSDF